VGKITSSPESRLVRLVICLSGDPPPEISPPQRLSRWRSPPGFWGANSAANPSAAQQRLLPRLLVNRQPFDPRGHVEMHVTLLAFSVALFVAFADEREFWCQMASERQSA
jgi:hypothetical protein